MKLIYAYDLPTRIFHWSFAILFASAFFIAKVIDDDSLLFSYHMLSGLMMVVLVLLRIFWGFIGSKTARWNSWKLSPKELTSYFKEILTAKTARYLGHNPASSYAAILMFLFTFGLGLSGTMMSLDINKHFFEEMHELMGNGFIVTVIAHIVGVLFHQFKHRDGMILSMITGKKQDIEGQVGITSQHKGVGVFLIGLLVVMGLYFNHQFDQASRSLNLLGVQLQLGENEHEHHHSGENKGHSINFGNEHEDDDD